ncbi:DUF2326 domain-containing protein [Bacillus sp. C1-1]|nr:DUF2326 domain-containing protein [Bacillus sp. C1-1]
MLKKIKSEIFNEEENTINLHRGLNVVLGDNKGSNSIGKSTVLMIIDFIYGGKAYITHNKDMVQRLGHHEFFFTFEFAGLDYYFIRNTENWELVYESNSNMEKINEYTISAYTQRLYSLYQLNLRLKFRAIVSKFSRVWGKNNDDIKKPLHNVANEKSKDTIMDLIKLFNLYEEINKQDKNVKILDDQKKVLNKASKYKFIPKITKTKYEKNLKQIDILNREIDKITEKAHSPTINVNELISDELIKIRSDKKKLLEEREYLNSRMNRTSQTIKKKANTEFENLLNFFPDVNLERLKKIESFHDDISSILAEELKSARQEIRKLLYKNELELNEINKKQEYLIIPNEEINLFIDKIIEYYSEKKKLQNENDYYIKVTHKKEEYDKNEAELTDIKDSIIQEIESEINNKIYEINSLIYSEQRTAPELSLLSNSYEYKIADNTGTGKAYTNLIIFDLSIITLTEIPYIIHDSYLFKNVEKEAVEQIIEIYNLIDKQIFISIDMINMFNQETQEILKSSMALKLSNEKLLTKLDWRDLK